MNLRQNRYGLDNFPIFVHHPVKQRRKVLRKQAHKSNNCYMNTFPEGIKFKYTWRNYQARILSELKNYLDDNNLHIVAPPGSGKTVLGLEVMLRLNKPTLIVAPTLAIRNQWISRFCELFLETEQAPEWISTDIHNPAFVTVSTYQGLHAACYDPESKHSSTTLIKEVSGKLQKEGIQTIIADEAHHLKNEWWNVLIRLKELLKPTIVGLTATPPYDVSPTEWQRYTELNGPIDSEITVPELIAEGDLCPHQDCICFSQPSGEEYALIRNFRDQTQLFFQKLKQDTEFIRALEMVSIWQEPLKNLDWIYSNVPYYSSLLIFFHSIGKKIPSAHWEILGNKKTDIPPFDFQWAETLLEFYLIKEPDLFPDSKKHREKLERQLVHYGLKEGNRITLLQNKEISSLLSTSIGKLNSIQQITDFEYQQLGKSLRMVILADYIRKEFLSNAEENTLHLNKLGVIPIFEKLRRSNTNGMQIGVLTGSIVILPVAVSEQLESQAERREIEKLSYSPLPYDTGYIQISLTESVRSQVVEIVTEIFQQGGIEVLIGTKSLLGEGWDAPTLNTLILASFVGSFVLSNQMRGRAIRTEKGNPGKTSNIWHLVSLDPTSPEGGEDIDMLRRRFRSFVGVSYLENGGIENGLNRLGLPSNLNNAESINQASFMHASQRNELSFIWNDALSRGVRLTEEIHMSAETQYEPAQTLKKLYLNRTISSLIAGLTSGLLVFGESIMEGLFNALKLARHSWEGVKLYLLVIGIFGIIIFGREAWNAFYLYIRYRDITKDLNKIGQALVFALRKAGVIHTNQLNVVTELNKDGSIFCNLEGGTRYENSVFIGALSEIVSPVNNPRYLIIRKSKSLFYTTQNDFHAVPESLGCKKEFASYLYFQWRKRVGNCELINARTLEGRKILLKARMKSLSAQFADTTEKVSRWK